MAVDITFSAATDITIQEAQVQSFTGLTVERMVDLPKEKKVFVFVDELRDRTLLWEGAAYDSIGQWTDSDVQARLLEIYG